MKVLAIIPARSGSKGFKDKNIAKINNKTLIELAVQVSKDTKFIDKICVSTDSHEYAKILKPYKIDIPGLRPKNLSTDKTRIVDVILYLLKKINEKFDYFILIQPTAPIRSPKNLNEAMSLLLKNKADSIVSVERVDEPHPEKIKKIDKFGKLKPYITGKSSEISRQQLPKAYKLNGAIYILKISSFIKEKTLFPKNTIPYVMQGGINIDNENDFNYLKYLYNSGDLKIYGL